MELDIDMTCVYEPRKYMDSALPDLQAMVDRYRTSRPTSRTLLRTLLRDDQHLSQWERAFHHATVNAARLQDATAIASCSHGRDLLSVARRSWRQACRSPEGRLAFLRAACADEELTPEALSEAVLWVIHGRAVPNSWAPLFLQVAFAVPRWVTENWSSENYVLTVPYWFPNSVASSHVVKSTHPTVNAVFPAVTDTIADTFAALWNPLENGAYQLPEAAYAAARALTAPPPVMA